MYSSEHFAINPIQMGGGGGGQKGPLSVFPL